MYRPSRMTVTRSEICLSSSRRWEMWTIPVAPLPQVADDPEQLVDLGVGQRGGGFVHDQDVRAEGERLGDLDHLLLGDGEAGDPGPRVELDVQLLEQLRGPSG